MKVIITGTDVMALPSGSAVLVYATQGGARVRRPWTAQVVERYGPGLKFVRLIGADGAGDAVVQPQWRYALLYRRDWDER